MKPYIDIVDSIKASSMTKFDGLIFFQILRRVGILPENILRRVGNSYK